MTHRSEWQLAFVGPRNKVIRLEKFLQKALTDKKRSTPMRTAISILLGNKTIVAENKKEKQKAIAFGHSNTNCDTVWDKLIVEVLTMARKKLKIKASYARLGENMADYEFNDEEGLRLYYERTLTEVQI